MSDRDLLQEIRENRQFAENEWKPIRAEAKKDRLCRLGKVWQAMDPDAVKQRTEKKRPYLNSDEITQYLNQVINDIRANPRGITFTPTGNGANDAGAEFYENHTREIEYRSKASVVYAHAAEDCIVSGMGWLRVTAKRQHVRTFDQDLWIEFIANADQVLPDPSMVWPDARDAKFLFYLEPWLRTEFQRRFPKARAASFSTAMASEAPQWVDRDRVDVGEYWELEAITRKLVAFRPTGQPDETVRVALLDELPDGKLPEGMDNLREEDADDTRVRMYLTNGLEILKEQTWAGKYIPFVACTGPTQYVEGKREVLSMVRLARDPVMYHAYALTCGAEALGGIPRAQWVGYEGQFAKPERWIKANHEPLAYLEAKVTVPGNPNPQQPLPLPQRQEWNPALQNIELVIDARRRGIQAAMGIVPQPTDVQRRNDVSGVAWKERQAQGQLGAYHFVDAYELVIERTGMIVEDLLDKIVDTARDMPVRKADGTGGIVRVNDPAGSAYGAQNQLEGDPIFTKGSYRCTVSTGPATESQRQEASEFVEGLVEQASVLVQITGPQRFGQIIAKAIKNKQLGPMGDEMADLFAPPAPVGPDGKPVSPEIQAAQAQIQQLQQQLAQAQQVIQTRAAEKQTELAGKFQIEKYKTDAESQNAALDREVKIAVAEIQAQAKQTLQDMALFYEERARVGAQIHEHAMGSQEIAANVALAHHAAQADATEHAKDRLHEHVLAAVGHQQAQELAAQQPAAAPADDGMPAAG